ncbi:MAG: hypothetical protein MZW92_70735 [Comamonadaceae bacterium]|nr:hypothetical protein [Comamonadaceae bacterium]
MLARRKEFGLLAHLGLTRAQVVARGGRRRRGLGGGRRAGRAGAGAGGEHGAGASWSTRRASTGRWTWCCPWGRLALLCAAVLVAGTATAAFSARRAAGTRGRAVGEGGLVNPARRRWLLLRWRRWRAAAALAGAASRSAPADGVRRGRALDFPRDHGAHLGARTEWWYATGWAGRSRRRRAEPRLPGHLLPQPHRAGRRQRQPLRGAAAAVRARRASPTWRPARHRHDQRIARWIGRRRRPRWRCGRRPTTPRAHRRAGRCARDGDGLAARLVDGRRASRST